MTISRLILPIAATAVLAFPMIGAAADRGVNEVSGSLAYTDIGDASTSSVALSWGRYLTPQHELGVNMSYMNTDLGSGPSIDGTTLGAFYQFNFDSGGPIVPFVGLDVAYIGGDLGDAYEWGYGASAGIKFYPYEHVGILMGVQYQNLVGAENFIDDEDGFNVRVGLAVRF